jgi:plastocyanin
MYNDLDSRALGRADCYAQRFMRPGSYQYNIVPGHAQAFSTDFPFVIHVKDGERKGGEMAQHDLRVIHDGKTFSPSPETLTIAVGDMVVWNGGGAIPFAVVGQQAFFNSHRMVNECGFTHAFGKAGEYRWQDAFGSKLSGVIRVADPDCAKEPHLKKWREALGAGTVVMIADGKVDHPEIDIMTGQTVFFAIVTTPGISITDSRLLKNRYEAPCSA